MDQDEAEELLIQQVERQGTGETKVESARMQIKTMRLKDKRLARIFLVIEANDSPMYMQ